MRLLRRGWKTWLWIGAVCFILHLFLDYHPISFESLFSLPHPSDQRSKEDGKNHGVIRNALPASNGSLAHQDPLVPRSNDSGLLVLHQLGHIFSNKSSDIRKAIDQTKEHSQWHSTIIKQQDRKGNTCMTCNDFVIYILYRTLDLGQCHYMVSDEFRSFCFVAHVQLQGSRHI